jgi:hypothetical protein
MSRAAISVFVFAIYLFVLGLVLVAFPNVFLSLFRLPETDEVWIRVVGMLLLILGYYYSTAAQNELMPILRASVIGRYSVLVFFIAFVLLDFAPPILVLFGVIDAVAATWTSLALRTQNTA